MGSCCGLQHCNLHAVTLGGGKGGTMGVGEAGRGEEIMPGGEPWTRQQPSCRLLTLWEWTQ